MYKHREVGGQHGERASLLVLVRFLAGSVAEGKTFYPQEPQQQEQQQRRQRRE